MSAHQGRPSRATVLGEFTEWRKAATTQRRKHIILARLWMAFGIHGAARAAEVYDLGPNVAQSIAVLFFISVYANYEGHMNEAGTYRVEQKQEEAEQAHAESTTPDTNT